MSYEIDLNYLVSFKSIRCCTSSLIRSFARAGNYILDAKLKRIWKISSTDYSSSTPVPEEKKITIRLLVSPVFSRCSDILLVCESRSSARVYVVEPA